MWFWIANQDDQDAHPERSLSSAWRPLNIACFRTTKCWRPHSARWLRPAAEDKGKETFCNLRRLGCKNLNRQQPIHSASQPLWNILSQWIDMTWMTHIPVCIGKLFHIVFTHSSPLWNPSREWGPKIIRSFRSNTKLGVLAGAFSQGDPLTTWLPQIPLCVPPDLSALELSPWTPGRNELQRQLVNFHTSPVAQT